MAVAAVPTTEMNSTMLTENEEKKLDYDVLLPGYIRSEVKSNLDPTPEAIISLLVQFAQVPDMIPDESTENFISQSDLQQCDAFKMKGNEYYKAKEYEQAIIKYSTALKYNPNNHFARNNRSLCYFLTEQYEEAKQDVIEAIKREPSFYKSWYRYGCIMEKLGNLRFAGIGYKIASNLTSSVARKGNNSFKKHYDVFCDNLRKLGHAEIIEKIENFERNENMPSSQDTVLRGLKEKYGEERLATLLNSSDGMEKMMEDVMQMTQLSQEHGDAAENELYGLARQSEYPRLIIQKPSLLNPNGGEWTISWTSAPVIHENKRMFNLVVASSAASCGREQIVAQYTHFGLPTAQDLLQYLYRSMAFANITGERRWRPSRLVVDWRSREMFSDIQTAMRQLGISCTQETCHANERLCSQNGTNVNGWNHMKF